MYAHYHEKISFSLNYVHLLQCIEWMHVVVLYVRAHSFSVTRLKKSGWVGLQSAPECKIRCNLRKIQFLPESISLCIYQFISLKRVYDSAPCYCNFFLIFGTHYMIQGQCPHLKPSSFCYSQQSAEVIFYWYFKLRLWRKSQTPNKKKISWKY